MESASAPKTEPDEQALQTIRAYHQRTKHRFDAYAPGPDTLDWDEQPKPFRHFEGTLELPLPLMKNIAQQAEFSALLRRPLNAPADSAAALGLEGLGMLLQLSLGITAWKSWGPDRWAVRANPSSGNLHPIEASLLLRNIHGLADGLYRYCPDTHTLERRADFERSAGPAQLFVALSSVTWREAWKYGERAFRYCQLDTGHAVGALRYAADLLGWPASEQRQVGTTTLEKWLGLDRSEDFAGGRKPYTEVEEAEILLALTDAPDLEWLRQACATARWHGKASVIDAHPMYRWPVIDEVALASRLPDGLAEPEEAVAALPGLSNTPDIAVAQLMLQRRSAQRFDGQYVMPQQDFFALLDATLPRGQAPWAASAQAPHIALLLFVHRVREMQPGLYLLPRSPQLADMMHARLAANFLRQSVDSAPPHLDLQLLAPIAPKDLQQVTRRLHCHQDIASNSCFALGMLAEFDPARYRDLFREAGLIGQALYLNAEAFGLRGTGIGCYFDDPFHELLGLQDCSMQSVYHFTVGKALDDPRIETTFSDDISLTP